MSKLLVNGKEPNRGEETAIRKELKSLYKDEVVEMALQYRYERNALEIKNDKLSVDLYNAENISSYLQQQLALTEKQLELTQKALELSYEHHKKESMPANWIYHITKEEYLIYFKQQAEKEKI